MTTIRNQVRVLLLQGLWPSEITAQISGASGRTVTQYCSHIISKMSEAEKAEVERLRAGREKPKGGVREFFQRPVLGARHTQIGSKIYFFRKNNRLSHSEFSERYSFANRVQLSKMEQGYHDFTLCEVSRLAEIMEVSFFDLLNPHTEVPHDLPSH